MKSLASPFGKIPAARSATSAAGKKQPRGTVNPRRQYEGAEAWLNDKLNRSFDSISLRQGGAFAFSNAGVEDRPKMTPAEYSILRHISVREHMKTDLQKLVENQTDGLSAIILEVEEMVKAIRFETLDVVEEISAWIDAQPVKRPFLYQGVNYLVKVCTDLGFLDQHQEIVERFCFEFKMNPLAYLGGGNIVVGFGASETDARGGSGSLTGNVASTKKSSKSSYLQSLASRRKGSSVYQVALDVDVDRLQRAERLIQQEFERRRGLPAPVPPQGYLDSLTSSVAPGQGPVLGWGPSETAAKPSAISFIEEHAAEGAGLGSAEASIDDDANDNVDDADGDGDGDDEQPDVDAPPHQPDAEPYSLRSSMSSLSGVGGYVGELLAVGVVDRAHGFSRVATPLEALSRTTSLASSTPAFRKVIHASPPSLPHAPSPRPLTHARLPQGERAGVQPARAVDARSRGCGRGPWPRVAGFHVAGEPRRREAERAFPGRSSRR
jgi:hypothetical protein